MANGPDKLEKILRAVAADVGSLKRDVGEIRLAQSRQFKELSGELSEMSDSVRRLQSDHAHLAGAVGIAISQLALAQSIVKRLERIEAAVFPSKH